jgi:microsomal dipeptidase-like Zn-dependent dipeptidase
MKNTIVDIHCHPALKPYGKSFNLSPVGQNNTNVKKENSLWHYDPPSITDKLLNYIGGLTKFSQANATSLLYGNVKVVCASLYPLEKGFVTTKAGTGIIGDAIENFITGIGKNRIDFLQQITDYFEDLQGEYDFYTQLHNVTVNNYEGPTKYIIARNYSDIEAADDETVCIVITIEGLHVLNTTKPEEEVLANVDKLKAWTFKPFFVTVAHHFWNNLCGHAKSLSGIVGSATDQSENINTGFTELGWKVVDKLLDQNNRILIDIKHMSALSRQQYLNRYKDVPVIISHGAANGLRNMNEKVVDLKDTGYKLQQEDINFYDDELIIMAKSYGIIGLQLDERRIASASTLSDTPHSLFRNKIMHYRSALLWNQVQHIAELLDKNDLFSWDCISIGSDFEGIVDPLNAFWTAEEMPFLSDFLERHAHNYMENRGKLLKSFNQISAHEIVSRIFSENALRFMKQHF